MNSSEVKQEPKQTKNCFTCIKPRPHHLHTEEQHSLQTKVPCKSTSKSYINKANRQGKVIEEKVVTFPETKVAMCMLGKKLHGF